MRELDVLLTTYLENDYAASAETDRAAFRRILALSDPDLMSYMLGGETPTDPEIASVVARIRGKTPS
jgi:antitoxin CptB